MNRKNFIKNNLLATGALLLPNEIWALDRNFNPASTSLNKFFSKPNLKRFKVSEIGTKFFETELSILNPKENLKLHRKYFISENIHGICTPAILETNAKESLLFIPELYKDKKQNGFIVKVCENGLCEETKIFTHENQGYYAFWGKEYLGRPTLYHYNAETFHLMRMHKENEQWINHLVIPIYPDEMKALYKQQIQQVEQGQLTQQFGYDFEIHKDGFYQFLALKNDWEQSLISKAKEEFEKANPARVYTNVSEIPKSDLNSAKLSYTNPFVAIYCKGDDLSHAIIKPTIIYEEVKDSKIEIRNMPAYKTQDDLGECRAFSLAAIIQQYTCEQWKSDIPNCKNPPADSALSYFGMMAFTNKSKEWETLRPSYAVLGMNDVINELSKSGNKLILESCKPFDKLVNNFSRNGKAGLALRDQFFEFLEKIYKKKKTCPSSDKANYPGYVTFINDTAGLNVDLTKLQKALTKESYEKFLYSLFFEGCKTEEFPMGFRAAAFPLDSMNVSPIDVKNQIIKGLKLAKPVLFPSLCVSMNNGDECAEAHSLVVSGYKKVNKVGNPSTYKEVFKLHNSWGPEWQRMNNDGWVDADVFTQNTVRTPSKSGYRIDSGSVIWLDP